MVDTQIGILGRRTLTNESISIRLATEGAVGSVMHLVRDCIEDMRQANIDQWDELYPNEETRRADANEGHMYLAALDVGPPIGALVLNDCQNPEYSQVPWTTSDERGAVVHRLMVDPRCQGRGIAREFMRFAEERARELGYGAIRLDAFAVHPRALRLYHGLGYTDVGCVTFRKGLFRSFEKSLGTVELSG